MGTYSYSGLFTECHLLTKQRSLQALRHFLKSFCNIQDTLHTSQWRYDREVWWSQSVLTLLPSSHQITEADSRKWFYLAVATPLTHVLLLEEDMHPTGKEPVAGDSRPVSLCCQGSVGDRRPSHFYCDKLFFYWFKTKFFFYWFKTKYRTNSKR